MIIDSIAQATWAPTDFPYQCLVDTRRTEAFRSAIRATVHPGDVVVDAGSGSGILAFFAASAGASRVYAVEIDPVLVSWLERSVRANGLADTVHVICGDIARVRLPTAVDVCICEMLDTGLLDETQVLALNQLRARRVLSESTRVIPERYVTFVELGAARFDCYGFRVLLPAHHWPQHADQESGWLPMPFQSFSPRTCVARADLRCVIEPRLSAQFSFVCAYDGEINAIRLSGRAYLTSRTSLGPTNAFNGDKIVPIDPLRVRRGQVVHWQTILFLELTEICSNKQSRPLPIESSWLHGMNGTRCATSSSAWPTRGAFPLPNPRSNTGLRRKPASTAWLDTGPTN